MENIINSIKNDYPVSEESIKRLTAHLTPCRFPKKHILVREGVYNKYAYFVEQGATRSYWLVEGKEITTAFSCEGGIVFSMDELYYNKLSEEFVETTEEVLLYSIPIKTLQSLFKKDHDLANWGRIIHQNGYRELHRAHKERLTLPAHKRYEIMKERLPTICSRVNLGHIASYLGITLPTLSKIRGKGLF